MANTQPYDAPTLAAPTYDDSLQGLYKRQDDGARNAAHLNDLKAPTPVPQQHLDASWSALSQDSNYVNGLRARAVDQMKSQAAGAKRTPGSAAMYKPGELDALNAHIANGGANLSLNDLRGFAAPDIVSHAMSQPAYQQYASDLRNAQTDTRFGVSPIAREVYGNQVATQSKYGPAYAQPTLAKQAQAGALVDANKARADGQRDAALINGGAGVVKSVINGVAGYFKTDRQQTGASDRNAATNDTRLKTNQNNNTTRLDVANQNNGTKANIAGGRQVVVPLGSEVQPAYKTPPTVPMAPSAAPIAPVTPGTAYPSGAAPIAPVVPGTAQPANAAPIPTLAAPSASQFSARESHWMQDNKGNAYLDDGTRISGTPSPQTAGRIDTQIVQKQPQAYGALQQFRTTPLAMPPTAPPPGSVPDPQEPGTFVLPNGQRLRPKRQATPVASMLPSPK